MVTKQGTSETRRRGYRGQLHPERVSPVLAPDGTVLGHAALTRSGRPFQFHEKETDAHEAVSRAKASEKCYADADDRKVTGPKRVHFF